MLMRLVTEPPRRPALLAIPSTIEAMLPPNASDSSFLPLSSKEDVADDIPPEPRTEPIKFGTFTSEGACCIIPNIWPMEVGSLDRAAIPLTSDAVVDSSPRVTAWPGSPSRDAILFTLLESRRLKSDDNTVAIDHLVTFLCVPAPNLLPAATHGPALN